MNRGFIMAGSKFLTSYLFEIEPKSSKKIYIPKGDLSLFAEWSSTILHSRVEYIDWLQTLQRFGIKVNKEDRYSPYTNSTHTHILAYGGKEIPLSPRDLVRVTLDEYWLPVTNIAMIRGGFIKLEENFPKNPTFICDEKSFEEYYNKARAATKSEIESKFTKVKLPRFIMCKY